MSILEDHKDELKEPLCWYAMSATFGRELKARDYLEEHSVRCYIPMRYEMVRNRAGEKKRMLVPAVRNLLFVHARKSRIQELKTNVNYLHYLVFPHEGRNIPIIVPDSQMEHFISVCDTHDDSLVYLTADEVNLNEGTRVRIIGGSFDGVEGNFVKVSGKRNKCVVVRVQGVAAVMIAKVSNAYLQVVQE